MTPLHHLGPRVTMCDEAGATKLLGMAQDGHYMSDEAAILVSGFVAAAQAELADLRESLAKAEGEAVGLRRDLDGERSLTHASQDMYRRVKDRALAAESRASALQSQVEMLAGALAANAATLEVTARRLTEMGAGSYEVTTAIKETRQALATLKETSDAG